MKYSELLQLPNWKDKKSEIIERDQNKCQSCFNSIFQNIFSSGLILGAKADELLGGRVNKKGESNNNFVWNIKQGYLAIVKVNAELKIDPRNNYVAYYKSHNYKLYALKVFDSQVNILMRKIHIGFDKDLNCTIEVDKIFSYETITDACRDISTLDVWQYASDLQVHHKYYQKDRMPW